MDGIASTTTASAAPEAVDFTSFDRRFAVTSTWDVSQILFGKKKTAIDSNFHSASMAGEQRSDQVLTTS
jgi:hypothetical protein